MNFDFLLLILLHRENDDLKNIINFSQTQSIILIYLFDLLRDLMWFTKKHLKHNLNQFKNK